MMKVTPNAGMGRLAPIFFLLALAVSASSASTQSEAGGEQEHRRSLVDELDVDAAMEIVVAEIKADLPVQVDRDTNLVDVGYSGSALTFYYSLIERDGLSKADWRARLSDRASEIQYMNCRNPTVIALIGLGSKVEFRYSLQDEEIWVLSIQGDACEADEVPANVPSLTWLRDSWLG